jgi:hypothetical protein
MTAGGIGDAAADVGEHRERWIHQDDGRHDRPIEMIIDLHRIEARDRNIRKEVGEQAGAGVRELVQDERAAGDVGQHREQSGAGGGLEHTVARHDGSGGECGQAERQRCRELLEVLALFRAPRMGGKKIGDFRERRQCGAGCPCFAQDRLAVLAQEHHGRGLAGVVARLPVPGA